MKAIIMSHDSGGSYLLDNEGSFRFVKKEYVSLPVGAEVEIKTQPATVYYLKAAALAACLVLVFALGVFSWMWNFETCYIYVDINPSVELVFNQAGKLKAANPLNSGGIEFLSGFKLRGPPENVVVSLIQAAEQEGYIIKGDSPAVLFTVVARGGKDPGKYSSALYNALVTHGMQGLAIIEVADEEFYAKAKELGISPGKLILMERLAEAGQPVTLDQILEMSVSDLAAAVRKAETPGISVTDNDFSSPEPAAIPDGGDVGPKDTNAGEPENNSAAAAPATIGSSVPVIDSSGANPENPGAEPDSNIEIPADLDAGFGNSGENNSPGGSGRDRDRNRDPQNPNPNLPDPINPGPEKPDPEKPDPENPCCGNADCDCAGGCGCGEDCDCGSGGTDGQIVYLTDADDLDFPNPDNWSKWSLGEDFYGDCVLTNIWRFGYSGKNIEDVIYIRITFTNGEAFNWIRSMGFSTIGQGQGNLAWVIEAPYGWEIDYDESFLITINTGNNLWFTLDAFREGIPLSPESLITVSAAFAPQSDDPLSEEYAPDAGEACEDPLSEEYSPDAGETCDPES